MNGLFLQYEELLKDASLLESWNVLSIVDWDYQRSVVAVDHS